MLYLAMSCFQGRPQHIAYRDLVKLNPDGIQLTPGNKVSENFKELINLPYRLHHSFCWNFYKRNLYDKNFIPINVFENHSIHPPTTKSFTGNFNDWINKIGKNYILETMYPGYLLGDGNQLNKAMELEIPLAVDISHIFIMKTQSVIDDNTINKLFNYKNIKEIHVSHNNGKYDTHQPLQKNTPFLNWALNQKNIPLVYEGYFHNLSLDEQQAQINLLK